MAHLKRQKVPKNWPIHRKGTKFVVRPNSNLEDGLPLLVILRDLLKVAQNRKEVKRAIYSKHILRNNKPARDEKNSLSLFDTISLVPSKKHYRLELTSNGKFKVSEIKEAEANHKIAKVVDKKTLKGKKVQLNLSDGKNFLSTIKCNTGDSVLINFKEKKLEKSLLLKDKAKVIVFGGKHAGKQGEIRKLKLERKMASVTAGKENLNVLIKQLMVIE
ncbi:MAG: hypothetical protein ABIB79_03180 [archaeon]